MTLPVELELARGSRLVVRSATSADAESWIANFDQVASEGVHVMTERVTRTVEEVRAQFQDYDPSTSL